MTTETLRSLPLSISIDLEPENNILEFPFKKGDKFLLLTVDLESRAAVTNIVADENLPYESGATSYVYSQVFDKLVQIANQFNIEICYMFSTDDDKLKAWAQHSQKGAKIFAWDSKEEEGTLFRAWKNFHPQTQVSTSAVLNIS